MAAAGSAVFSIFGLAIAGPVTVPVGMLGGILAVVLSGTRRGSPQEPPAESDDTPIRQGGPSSRRPGT
jgi:hypothetical protein